MGQRPMPCAHVSRSGPLAAAHLPVKAAPHPRPPRLPAPRQARVPQQERPPKPPDAVDPGQRSMFHVKHRTPFLVHTASLTSWTQRVLPVRGQSDAATLRSLSRHEPGLICRSRAHGILTDPGCSSHGMPVGLCGTTSAAAATRRRSGSTGQFHREALRVFLVHPAGLTSVDAGGSAAP